MTAQNKLKKFLRWLGNSHSHTGSSTTNASPEFHNHTHPPLQRSRTECMNINYSLTPSSNQDLSHSYDESDRRHSLTFTEGAAYHGSSPLLSYREALGPQCDESCTCECHKNELQSHLTLCRCHMSGYESYRKAVYGGRAKQLNKSNRNSGIIQEGKSRHRKSLDTKKFGSADTLGSSHSTETIKAFSDHSGGATGSSKSTDTSDSGSKRRSSSLHRHSQRAATSRERDRTITDDIRIEVTEYQTPEHLAHYRYKVGSKL